MGYTFLKRESGDVDDRCCRAADDNDRRSRRRGTVQMSNWLHWTIVVLSAGLLCRAAQWVRKADLPPWLYCKREDQKIDEIAVSDGWHYAEGRKTVGPLTLTEMQRVLSKVMTDAATNKLLAQINKSPDGDDRHLRSVRPCV